MKAEHLAAGVLAVAGLPLLLYYTLRQPQLQPLPIKKKDPEEEEIEIEREREKIEIERELKVIKDRDDLIEKINSLKSHCAILVLGTQHAGKSSLINSLYSILEGHYFPASAAAPSSNVTKTLSTKLYPMLENPNVALIDTKGFEQQNFQQFSNKKSEDEKTLKELIEGKPFENIFYHKPVMALFVVSPEQADNWVEIIRNLAHHLKQSHIRYVVVITNKDQVESSKRVEITEKIRESASIDDVNWVVNFDPYEVDSPRLLQDLKIQSVQLKFWKNIFQLLIDDQKVKNHLPKQNDKK